MAALLIGLVEDNVDFEAGLPALSVFLDGNEARNLLGLLWQVEGSILALVTAVVLFAFEGLTRSRPAVPIWEYAARSGLAQYLMLGGAGLSSIPVVLFWPAPRPPVAATHVVALISIAGIALLPALVYGAMRIIDASWLREQRLSEVEATVASLVREEAIERVALGELQNWAKNAGVDVQTVFTHSVGPAQQKAASRGSVFDINLSRLRSVAKQSDAKLVVLARVGDQVWKDSPLIATRSPDPVQLKRPIYTLTTDDRQSRINRLLTQLKEEGVEALRSESSAGLAAVVDSYTELWLAWPRAWAAYGQRLENNFLDQLNLFRFTPIDELRHDIWGLLDAAFGRDLREQTLALAGIPYRVGSEAIALDAPDILKGASRLATSSLRFPKDPKSDLQELLNSKVCRHQVDLCSLTSGIRLEDSTVDIRQKRQAAEAIEILLRSVAECLKILFDNRSEKLFHEVDKEFSKLFRDWNIDLDEVIARQALADPGVATSLSVERDEALASLELNELRASLIRLRDSLRIAVLGWGLHVGTKATLDADTHALLLGIARSFTDTEDAVAAVGLALEHRKGPMADWVLSSLPTGDVHSIDDAGPVLRALGLILLVANPGVISPAEWMIEERVDRLKGFVAELSEGSIMSSAGIDGQEASLRAERLAAAIDEARAEQVRIEREDLIRQPLDPAKVATFRQEVLKAWREQSVLAELLALCGTSTARIPSEQWGRQRFGFEPKLLAKGLFVSPTNWVGLEHSARDLGAGLARGEFGAVAANIRKKSRKIRGKGNPRERLQQAIEALVRDEYRPSLVIIPASYRIARDLGLPARWQRMNRDRLGKYAAGDLFGLPAVESRGVDQSRFYVVDLARFLRVEEASVDSGEPREPLCEIEGIDQARAEKILRSWKRTSPNVGADEKDLQTRVGVVVQREVRFLVTDPHAARSVSVYPVSRDKSGGGSGGGV
ncbi:hypothetical protein ACIBD9_32080 [Micromonospora sp. NPDC050784]|uniref:hypothetical protein n=1 Tax=Micromonospora sp. NPDC050784 TaxID=3364281 RepID=UPI00379A6DD9